MDDPREAARKTLEKEKTKEKILEESLLVNGEVEPALQAALDDRGPLYEAIQRAIEKREAYNEKIKDKPHLLLKAKTRQAIKDILNEGQDEDRIFSEMEKYLEKRALLDSSEGIKFKEWSYTDQPISREHIEDEPVLFKPNFLTKGDIHFIVGKAGVGKSYLSTQIALCLKGGTPFLGMHPAQKQKVVYLSFEDTHSRFLKRIQGIGEVPEGELHLFTNLAAIATVEKGRLETSPQGKALLKSIAHLKADVLVIDTYAQAFLLDDGDNGSAQKVGNFLRKNFPGMTLLILHHPRKTEEFKTVKDIHVDAVRGASAIVGYARSVFYLHKLDGLYPLVTLKSNYGPPFPGHEEVLTTQRAFVETPQGKKQFQGFVRVDGVYAEPLTEEDKKHQELSKMIDEV